MADFPNMEKETDIQIHEAQRVPNKRNPKYPQLWYIIIKVSNIKDKEITLKAARGKTNSYV